MVAVSDFSGLASSIWAFANAPAIAPMVSLFNKLAALEPAEPIRRYEREHPGEALHDRPPPHGDPSRRPPDLQRLARTPWPMASLASCGISFLSSSLAASCSR